MLSSVLDRNIFLKRIIKIYHMYGLALLPSILFQYLAADHVYGQKEISLCPTFHYVRGGFSSFKCIRPRTQRNDCSALLCQPFHYVRSVVDCPVVSAVICYRSIISAGNLRGLLYQIWYI